MALAIRLANGTAAFPAIPTQANDGQTKVVVAWFTLNIIGGHFLLPILVATFLFTKARRDVTLINLLITMILTSVFSCLLLYTGEYMGTPPNKSLCLFQAATVNAGPPMWSTAIVVFVLYIWSSIGCGKVDPTRLNCGRVVMIVAPYAVFFPFLIVTILLGGRHPETVTRSRRFLYCSTNQKPLDIASRVYTSINACIAVAFTVLIVIRFYRSYNYHRRASGTGLPTNTLAVRLCLFVLYSFIGLIFSAWNTFASHNVNTNARDMYIASLSITVFLIFGTQRDVFYAWYFWRARPRRLQSPSMSRPHSIITTSNVPMSSGTTLASNGTMLPSNSSVVIIGDPTFDDDSVSLRPNRRRDEEKSPPEITNPSTIPVLHRVCPLTGITA
ncbi:hypothetical protein OF83DRAFT_1170343 [Amylostereum chailletii]|nr:hypothetical protein OF83DRAFT_1170343 [Amylostereum chailletii]